MFRATHLFLLAAAGLLPSEPAPGIQMDAPERESMDRAFAHALSLARSKADGLDFSVDHSSWEDPWVVQSDHYELRTTASRAYGVRMVNTLEGMLPIYQELFDTDKLPQRRVPVLIHPTQEAYSQYGDDHSDERSSIWGGYFDPNNPGGAIATVFDKSDSLQRMYLVRSSCQEFIHSAFGSQNLPVSLTQGLGAYAETFWVWDFLLSRFEQLRDAGQLIPLGELLTANRDAYVDRVELFNVQLAVTITYLRMFREDTRSELNGLKLVEAGSFDEYVRKAVRGEKLQGDPVHALLTEETDALDAEIRAFRGWRGN